MYFIFIIVFFIAVALITMISMGSLLYIVDCVSLLGIVLLAFPMLAASGLLKDFLHSFSIAFGKTCTADQREISRALTAVKLTSKLVLFSGILVSLLGLLTLLHQLDDPASIGPNVSVALIALVYALFLSILLLPVKARLELLSHSCD